MSKPRPGKAAGIAAIKKMAKDARDGKLEIPGYNGGPHVVSSPTVDEAKVVSLKEAEALAKKVLLDAERRRGELAQREADEQVYWEPVFDVHKITAAKRLGKRPEDVTDEERMEEKTRNFGFLYGSSPVDFEAFMQRARRNSAAYAKAAGGRLKELFSDVAAGDSLMYCQYRLKPQLDGDLVVERSVHGKSWSEVAKTDEYVEISAVHDSVHFDVKKEHRIGQITMIPRLGEQDENYWRERYILEASESAGDAGLLKRIVNNLWSMEADEQERAGFLAWLREQLENWVDSDKTSPDHQISEAEETPVFMDAEEDGWRRAADAAAWLATKEAMGVGKYYDHSGEPRQFPCWFSTEHSSGDYGDMFVHMFLYEAPLPAKVEE